MRMPVVRRYEVGEGWGEQKRLCAVVLGLTRRARAARMLHSLLPPWSIQTGGQSCGSMRSLRTPPTYTPPQHPFCVRVERRRCGSRQPAETSLPRRARARAVGAAAAAGGARIPVVTRHPAVGRRMGTRAPLVALVRARRVRVVVSKGCPSCAWCCGRCA
ncbi:hypothetical protein DFH06DRAFT_577581 [Mycena polygramma]|nr:hypothetical protein DFH06DRAFT_577581 [Mycena polygramma]